jgi:hypothetical protein
VNHSLDCALTGHIPRRNGELPQAVSLEAVELSTKMIADELPKPLDALVDLFRRDIAKGEADLMIPCMRTSKELYHDERIMYKPELSGCPHCEGPLVTCGYLAWGNTVQTLDGILSVASRPGSCVDPTCHGRYMQLLPMAKRSICCVPWSNSTRRRQPPSDHHHGSALRQDENGHPN